MAVLVMNTVGHLQNQLTRSLERILEDAHQSGELKLSNRKLKDLPAATSKYDLSDTVIADLSKNRLSELPDEVTTFHFLESLHCYHNAIRTVPETIGSLQCLSYLDLSRNQLTTLPRELCLLPIQILLVSNNRLSALPDEFCRLTQLTELDASCNRLTHLPGRLAELQLLQSLVLRANRLQCVPADVTALVQLVRLDLRANRIAALPVEMRDMRALIELRVEENPLTMPPASLCKRGRVHIFKYLETEAARLGHKVSVISSGTLSRRGRKCVNNATTTLPSNLPTTVAPPANLPDRLRSKRHHVDSGYSTSDDKRWSQEITGEGDKHWSSTPINNRISESSRSNNSTPSTISPGPEYSYEEETKTSSDICDKKDDRTSKDCSRISSCTSESTTHSNIANGHSIEEKTKALQQTQTYKEYKEALRQQRAQDVPSVYRTKDSDDTPPPTTSNTAPTTPTHHAYQHHYHQYHHTTGGHGYRTQHSVGSGANSGTGGTAKSALATSRSDPTPLNTLLLGGSSGQRHVPVFDDTMVVGNGSNSPDRKPVQKVTPLRSVSTTAAVYEAKNGAVKYQTGEDQSPPTWPETTIKTPCSPETVRNGNNNTQPIVESVPPRFHLKSALSSPTNSERNGSSNRNYLQDYVKPSSPIMNGASNALSHDHVPPPANASGPSTNGKMVKYANGTKSGKSISWNNDVSDKISFTMRREIDKAKEETDLINQLRNIIESRLKMQLPHNLAPSLTDGVVLCHLANLIKPRSIASIHVPSPAVPKLTMARCRRNVDNFIEACRKIGVDEAHLCHSVDVTEALLPGGRGLPRVLATVRALCKHHPLTADGDGDVVDGDVRDTCSDMREESQQQLLRQQQQPDVAAVRTRTLTTYDTVLSLFLLAGFVATVVLLIAFPPPN